MTDSLESLWKDLENDRSRGSSELAHDVLSSLLQIQEGSPEPSGLTREAVARNLRNRRPEMSLLVNLGHALSEGSNDLHGEGSGRTLTEDLRTLLRQLQNAGQRIAEAFRTSPLSLQSPLVFSRSGTVLELIDCLEPSGTVTVLQSHPGDEGVSVANELVERFDVQFCYDLEALARLRDSDLLMVGADSYDADGTIRNKVGTELLARASGNLPVVSCFQTLKYEPPDGSRDGPEEKSPEKLSGTLRRNHPIFERIRADALDYYVTDRGVFESAEELRAATRSLRTARERTGSS